MLLNLVVNTAQITKFTSHLTDIHIQNLKNLLRYFLNLLNIPIFLKISFVAIQHSKVKCGQFMFFFIVLLRNFGIRAHSRRHIAKRFKISKEFRLEGLHFDLSASVNKNSMWSNVNIQVLQVPFLQNLGCIDYDFQDINVLTRL